jgi:adenylate cyclase
MDFMLRFHLSNKREQQQFEHHVGPIEFGRGPKRDNTARCVIQDLAVSRDHVRIEEINGKVKVENLSQKNPVRLGDSGLVDPGKSCDLMLPVRLTIGETIIDVEPTLADPIAIDSLTKVPHAPRPRRHGDSTHTLGKLGGSPSPETLAHWFETVLSVQRAAAGSAEFYQETAKALVDLVGLDRGLVLLRKDGGWEVAARCVTEHASGREFSQTTLNHVLAERRTFYQASAAGNTQTSESLQGVEAVVASPIFGPEENIVGAVYGSRSQYDRVSRTIGIGPLEAQVVQLLASAAGAGLARLERDAEAMRQRVQFEQFVSADVARELHRNPRLLEGQEREVTIMFSDIRGFSRLSEKLGPRDTCKLVAQVMDRLTNRIREFGGMLVDYMGDGLIAMWNAPTDHPCHAASACRAALAMLGEMPALSAQWQDVIEGNLAIGVGLNTGPAMVGNTGSAVKFKYGPLGHTVNLASRVEGATKHFGVPALISGSTRIHIGEGFATRRLCRVRVLGIGHPVDLYELHAEGLTPEWTAKRDRYEAALALYESGQWHEVYATLAPLLTDTANRFDIPCLDLLQRTVECIRTPPKEFDPVLDLLSK